MLVSCFTSGLAGVSLEKIVKSKPRDSYSSDTDSASDSVDVEVMNGLNGGEGKRKNKKNKKKGVEASSLWGLNTRMSFISFLFALVAFSTDVVRAYVD